MGEASFQASPDRPVGWRGDGSGDFPGARPPLRWSEDENLRWKTALPNWSNSAPILVGDRVFLLAEPIDYAPLLLCYDADTGAELWRVTIDHLQQLPESEREPAVADWSEDWQRARDGSRFRILLQNAHDEKNRTDWQLVSEQARSAGWTVKVSKGDSITVQSDSAPALDKQQRRRLGLWFNTWGPNTNTIKCRGGLSWVGYTYNTPVSDGTHVWVFTGYHVAACYDLAGKEVWLRKFPLPYEPGKEFGGGNSWPGCAFTANPLLSEGVLLLADSDGHFVRGVDAASGRTLWEHLIPQLYSIHAAHTPALFHVDDTAFLYHSSGKVFRVKDGELMLSGLARTSKGAGSPIAHGNQVFAYGKEGNRASKDKSKAETHAYTFHLRDGVLQHDTIWRFQGDATGTLYTQAGVFHDGQLWSSLCIDAKDGRILATTNRRRHKTGRPMPVSGYGIPYSIVGGTHLLCAGTKGYCGASDGTFWMLNLETLAIEATNHLQRAEPVGAKLRQIQEQCSLNEWNHFGNAPPFLTGDRIYIRSFDHLYCIANEP